MVLVTVISKMREYKVRADAMFQRFEKILDRGAFKGEVAVPELLDDDLGFSGIAKKYPRTFPCFGLPAPIGGKDDPANGKSGLKLSELPNSGAAANFDVIAVGAQAEDVFDVVQRQTFHGFAIFDFRFFLGRAVNSTQQ